jgi:hypothetical protein
MTGDVDNRSELDCSEIDSTSRCSKCSLKAKKVPEPSSDSIGAETSSFNSYKG